MGVQLPHGKGNFWGRNGLRLYNIPAMWPFPKFLANCHDSRCVGERVTSCELSSELVVSSSSSSVSLPSPTEVADAGTGGRVAVNSTVQVSCRNSTLVLSGSAQLTCQQDASWDHDLPTCQQSTSLQCSDRSSSTDWRYVALVAVLWRPALWVSSSSSSASVTALR